MSERIRRMVNRPIGRDELREFLARLTSADWHFLRMYMILGFPTETTDDYAEFFEDLQSITPRYGGWLSVHVTPFRAMPATPGAVWPMDMADHRSTLSRYRGADHCFFGAGSSSDRIRCYEENIESLPTVALDVVLLRGDEGDAENVAGIARTKKFWSSSGSVKLATLSKAFDLDRLFGRFTWETLPTRYLRGPQKESTIRKLSERIDQADKLPAPHSSVDRDTNIS
ncbi:MAG: hypothetical protein V1755_00635 [Chloroflexota bacterium]